LFLQQNELEKSIPKYDNLGFLINTKFSKDGMLRIIQIVNSLILGLSIWLIISMTNLFRNETIQFLPSFIFSIILFILYDKLNSTLVSKAEEDWKERIEQLNNTSR